MITQKRLKELFTYNPETGLFIRNISIKGRFAEAGMIAGTKSLNGYIAICVDRKSYFAHRLAWLYMTGKWPKELIDHINLVRDDNRWNNLREASYSQNSRNSGARKNNKLGVKGVMKTKGGYAVTLGLGTYKTLDEAKEIFNKAIEIFHKEFAFKQ